jgi:hypothetical protein
MRLREANCNTNSGLDNFLEKNKDQKEGLSTEYLVYAALDLIFFDILETLKDRQNCQHLLMFILQLYVHFVPNLVGPTRDSYGFTQMNGQGEKEWVYACFLNKFGEHKLSSSFRHQICI